MKFDHVALSFLVLALAQPVSAKRREQANANPISKVVQLLSDLQAKITKEGEEAQKIFEEFSEWCEDRSKNLGFEIKTAKGEIEELQAAIQGASAKIDSLSATVDHETGNVKTSEADLEAAKAVRAKEQADFNAKEAELNEVIDMLNRARGILEREMQKSGAAMVQVDKVPGVIEALRLIVASAALETEDAAKLTAFVQNARQGDVEGDVGAPAGAVYTSQSGSIIETLADLLSKAEEQLDSARKAETTARHNFELLEQSLTDAIAVSSKQVAKSQKGIAETSGLKANQEADLARTSKSLAEAGAALEGVEHDCMTRANDFEVEKATRAAELKALAEAKGVIVEKTGGAEDRAYGLAQTAPVSFMQLGRTNLRSGVDLANFEVVRFVRGLARKQNSEPLALLARRMSSAMQVASLGGDDPFEKVRGLISVMIERLEADASADATHKAHCDKEMSETKAKQDDKEAEIEKLTTTIDVDTAHSDRLKEEVAELQKALAALAKTQAEMDKLRVEENTEYKAAKSDTENGIDGVKTALSVLRDYYGGDGSGSTAKGAGDGIIGLLEVVESDFTKMLAQLTAAEETAAAEYEKTTKENQIEKTTKDSDVKYKTKEAKQLDGAVADATTDRSGVQDELSAVLEYHEKLVKECVAVAETFEERKARFAAEIAGLKEALAILENETAFLERGVRHLRRGSGHRALRAA